jgi:hypothetical protein
MLQRASGGDGRQPVGGRSPNRRSIPRAAKLQSDRLLANLVNIPAAVITAEASYHAVYDHCTAKYLAQAGVKVTALSLGDQGVHGNAHMIMLEKNNLQVAAVIARWLARTVPAR